MKTLLIGRDSNISRHLEAAVGGCELVSARELIRDGALLDKFRGESVRIVINAFRPSVAVRETRDQEAYVTQALLPTARTLDACRHLAVERIVYTSSAAVYGENPHCHEDDPPAPRNVHAALKLAAEKLVEDGCQSAGLPFTVVRLFNVFGGDDQFSVVSKVIGAARTGSTLTVSNGGRAARDYIHVDDVVRIYRALLDHPSPPARINAASGRGVSVRELVDAARSAGADLPTQSVQLAEIERSIGSTGRLASLVDPAGFRRVEEYLAEQVRA